MEQHGHSESAYFAAVSKLRPDGIDVEKAELRATRDNQQNSIPSNEAVVNAKTMEENALCGSSRLSNFSYAVIFYRNPDLEKEKDLSESCRTGTHSISDGA